MLSVLVFLLLILVFFKIIVTIVQFVKMRKQVKLFNLETEYYKRKLQWEEYMHDVLKEVEE